MHKGIFITGTDTGVGKTFIAEGLLEALRGMGWKACPMKPVETGCRRHKGVLIPMDAVRLLKAARANEPLNSINPYRFRQPLAPAVAAELENTTVRKQRILSAFKSLKARYDITVVEGAGGIMVPLHGQYLLADLARDMGIPILVIARPGLGTINHTVLTVEAAKRRGLRVLGVVINHSSKCRNDVSARTNPSAIEKICGVPVLKIVPYIERAGKRRTGLFKGLAGRLGNSYLGL